MSPNGEIFAPLKSKITAGRLYPYYTFSHRELILLRQIYINYKNLPKLY